MRHIHLPIHNQQLNNLVAKEKLIGSYCVCTLSTFFSIRHYTMISLIFIKTKTLYYNNKKICTIYQIVRTIYNSNLNSINTIYKNTYIIKKTKTLYYSYSIMKICTKYKSVGIIYNFYLIKINNIYKNTLNIIIKYYLVNLYINSKNKLLTHLKLIQFHLGNLFITFYNLIHLFYMMDCLNSTHLPVTISKKTNCSTFVDINLRYYILTFSTKHAKLKQKLSKLSRLNYLNISLSNNGY